MSENYTGVETYFTELAFLTLSHVIGCPYISYGRVLWSNNFCSILDECKFYRMKSFNSCEITLKELMIEHLVSSV